jgi:hypothetical protein
VRGHLLLLLAWVSFIRAGEAQVNPESMALTFQGTGACVTRTFTVQDSWHMEWTCDSAIKVKLISSDNSNQTVADSTGNGTSAPGLKAGTYSLEISSSGTWQLTIYDSAFVKNKTINGATPYTPVTTTPSPVTPPPLPPSTTVSAPQPGHQRMVASFHGEGTMTTRSFSVLPGWEIHWTTFGPTKVSLVNSEGTSSVLTDPANPLNLSAAASLPAGAPTDGVMRESTGGDFTLKLEGTSRWIVFVIQNSSPDASVASNDITTPPTQTSPQTMTLPLTTPTPTPVSTAKMTEDQARAVVIVEGDNAQGTGFLVKTPTGPAVVTNLHVLSNNPNIKIHTSTGEQITILSLKGAADRDLAMLSIKDGTYNYLDLAPDVSATVQTGDDVITPGNSEGGEVVVNTGGKVVGIGPQRIEFSNPIYHGNSGGPVVQASTGKVVGVVTEVEKVDVSNDLDKTSFESRASGISGPMRYFGLRLDTVKIWEPYDWRRFLTETQFLAEFHKQSLCLDSFLNAPEDNSQSNGGNNDAPSAKLYLTDEKIRRANENFYQQASGADSSQRLDALRGLLFELGSVADTNMAAIQDPTNFYTFDQQRAREEVEYRKALKAELDSIGNNVSRLGGLARKSN